LTNRLPPDALSIEQEQPVWAPCQRAEKLDKISQSNTRGEGLEWPREVFKTAALNHSDTLPSFQFKHLANCAQANRR
jgi:hypothetical protein